MRRRQRSGGGKEQRSAERCQKESLWREARDVSALIPRDYIKREMALGKTLRRLRNSPGNEFVSKLMLLALSTRSAKFIDALDELIDLKLDGKNWEDRLGHLYQKHKALDELSELTFFLTEGSIFCALREFAAGATQRTVARMIATRFLKSNSYDAAVQRARMWLREEDSPQLRLLRLLNKIPLGERRRALAFARAAHMIPEGQKISVEQAEAVIWDVLKAHYKVTDEELAAFVGEKLAQCGRQ